MSGFAQISLFAVFSHTKRQIGIDKAPSPRRRGELAHGNLLQENAVADLVLMCCSESGNLGSL